MGLSGRKDKQRIPADPRNLTWANDANKFGAAYLQKFGWDSSTGLGPSGEGRTRHISVHQKLDMLGIGADHRNSEDGTAWKQGRDFENLLQRLNQDSGIENGAGDVMKKEDSSQADNKREKRKRKKSEKDVDEVSVDGPKTRKKSKKHRDASEHNVQNCTVHKDESIIHVGESLRPTISMPRPLRAHRARHIASKGLASKSSAAISEILGVSASIPSPPFPTVFPHPTPSVAESTRTGKVTSTSELKLQDLTTSSKSVMDYFREKLAAKSSRVLHSKIADSGDDNNAHARVGLGASKSHRGTADDADRPNIGLGMSRHKTGIMSMMFATGAHLSEKKEEEPPSEPLENPIAKPKKDKKDKKGKRRAEDSSNVADVITDHPTQESMDGGIRFDSSTTKKNKKTRKDKEHAQRADVHRDGAQNHPATAAGNMVYAADSEEKTKRKREKKERRDKTA